MAILDYFDPRNIKIFEQTNPMYEGLLGPEQSKVLSQRSNIAGLLGTAAALAAGMSKQGPRRSGLQNVLGALGAGYGASGQAYQGGIEQMANAQKLAQLRLQMNQTAQTQQAIEGLINDPRIKSDPLKIAYIRSNPSEALKLYSELLPIQEAARGTTVTPSVQPTAPAQVAVPVAPVPYDAAANAKMKEILDSRVAKGIPLLESEKTLLDQLNATATSQIPISEQYVAAQDKQLQPTGVSANISRAAPLIAQRDALLDQIRTFNQPQFVGNSKVKEIIDNANKSLETINKQLDRSAVEEYDWAAIQNTVPQEFKNRVANLKQIAETGALSANELSQRMAKIEEDATNFVTKKTDFTNQDRRVFGGMFQTPDGKPRAIETASPIELMQLENKLYDMRITEKKAGAATINMPSESERTAGYLTTRLKNSLQQYQIAIGQTPKAAMPNMMGEIIKGVTRSDYLKNLATPESRQRVEAAQLDMLDAALTMATGAAYTREQLESTRRTLFPELGDKPATIRDKAKRLDDLLKEAAMTKAGRSAPKSVTEPAFTPNDISNAAQQELDRRKGK